MLINLSDQGFAFWPVSAGDSASIRLTGTVSLQIVLQYMGKSGDCIDAPWPIDELTKRLMKYSDKPLLSIFAHIHPSQDYCRGFKYLNRHVLISELWMSAQTFREFRENSDLCDDAQAFYNEAMRRVKQASANEGDPGPGDRIHIIGDGDLLQEPKFKGFPENLLHNPSQPIAANNGKGIPEAFEAFARAPLKDGNSDNQNGCTSEFRIFLYKMKLSWLGSSRGLGVTSKNLCCIHAY